MLIDQRFDVFIECFYIKWQLSESFDESGISKDFINAFCQELSVNPLLFQTFRGISPFTEFQLLLVAKKLLWKFTGMM